MLELNLERFFKTVFIATFSFASGGLMIKCPFAPYVLLAWLFSWNLFTLQEPVPFILRHRWWALALPVLSVIVGVIFLSFFLQRAGNDMAGGGIGIGILLVLIIPFFLYVLALLLFPWPIAKLLSCGKMGWYLLALAGWLAGILWGGYSIYEWIFLHKSFTRWAAEGLFLGVVIVSLLFILRCQNKTLRDNLILVIPLLCKLLL